MMSRRTEEWHDWRGVAWKVHNEASCMGANCVIHRPSRHKMSSWPIILRGDRAGLAERICKDGVGHPDPDSLAYFAMVDPQDRGAWSVHGCDGCCYDRGKPMDPRFDAAFDEVYR
jgi:hypothetical protein